MLLNMNYTVTCLEVAFMIVLSELLYAGGGAFEGTPLPTCLNVKLGRRIYLFKSSH